MSDKFFVDTNILVYARDAGAGQKHLAALDLMTRLWKKRTGVISVQVLNEYYVTVTQKLKPGLSSSIAWSDINALSAWSPVTLDWDLLRAARKLCEKHSLSWWDSLIIAAAKSAGCAAIYSEDMSNGAKYGGVAVVNPFL